MLQNLKLKNCGPISLFKNALNQINVFVGPSNTGKTTLLESVFLNTTQTTHNLTQPAKLISSEATFACLQTTYKAQERKTLIYPHKTTFFLNEKNISLSSNQISHVFLTTLDYLFFQDKNKQVRWLFARLANFYPACSEALTQKVQQIQNCLTKLQTQQTPIVQQQETQKLIHLWQETQIWFAKTKQIMQEIGALMEDKYQNHKLPFRFTPISNIHLHNNPQPSFQIIVQILQTYTHKKANPQMLFVGEGFQFDNVALQSKPPSPRQKNFFLFLLDLAAIHLFTNKQKQKAIWLIDDFDFLASEGKKLFWKNIINFEQIFLTQEQPFALASLPQKMTVKPNAFSSFYLAKVNKKETKNGKI